MNITEIRIKLMEESEDRLRGFCSITIDHGFVIRDLKIIDGSNGPFVAMPSRKLSGHCQRCRHKNHLRSRYCNHCGAKQQQENSGHDSPQKLYADVAHPINSECREHIQNAVLTEFNAELARYQQPGYRSRYDDEFGFEDIEVTPSSSSRTPATGSVNQDSSAPVSESVINEDTDAVASNTTSATTTDEPSRAATTPTPSAKNKTDKEPQATDSSLGKQQRIDSPAADSAVDAKIPGQPHFSDRKSEAASQGQDDDSFGSGVF